MNKILNIVFGLEEGKQGLQETLRKLSKRAVSNLTDEFVDVGYFGIHFPDQIQKLCKD